MSAMVGSVDEPTCWHCSKPVEVDADACVWCGVWLNELQPGAVPAAFVALLPIARRWGIGDDGYRWDAIKAASVEERREITEAVDGAGDELDDWLAGPAAEGTPTREYVALTCLTMAYDEADEA